jgi:hypothetical protein
MKTRVQNAKNIHIYSVSVINPLEFQFDKKKSLYFVTTKAVRIIPTSGGLDYRHGTGHGVGAYLSVHEGMPWLVEGITEHCVIK